MSGTPSCEIQSSPTVEVKDRQERYKGIGRYASTKALLVDYMKVVANTKYAKTQAALDVCLC